MTRGDSIPQIPKVELGEAGIGPHDLVDEVVGYGRAHVVIELGMTHEDLSVGAAPETVRAPFARDLAFGAIDECGEDLHVLGRQRIRHDDVVLVDEEVESVRPLVGGEDRVCGRQVAGSSMPKPRRYRRVMSLMFP